MTDVEAYYDALSEVYPEIATFPIREHATWPGTRSLLGDVAGERVLDAGCGTGEHTAALAAEGAEVVGVDLSEAMLERARERFGDGGFAKGAGNTEPADLCGDGVDDPPEGSVTFQRGDLQAGLSFEDGSFDIVLCQLVLSHVPDLAPVLSEFERVLASDGRLVIATHHPFHDFRIAERREYPRVEVGSTMELEPEVEPETHPPRYHADETVRVSWSDESPDTEYSRRSLSTLVSALLSAGFLVDGIEEPVPDAAFRDRWPDAYEEFVSRPPEVLCLRGRVADR